jgi:hypothetical protein
LSADPRDVVGPTNTPASPLHGIRFYVFRGGYSPGKKMKVLCRTELPDGLVILTTKFREHDFETVVDCPPYRNRQEFLDLVPSKDELTALSDHRRMVEKWKYKLTDEVPGGVSIERDPKSEQADLDYIFGPVYRNPNTKDNIEEDDSYRLHRKRFSRSVFSESSNIPLGAGSNGSSLDGFKGGSHRKTEIEGRSTQKADRSRNRAD